MTTWMHAALWAATQMIPIPSTEAAPRPVGQASRAQALQVRLWARIRSGSNLERFEVGGGLVLDLARLWPEPSRHEKPHDLAWADQCRALARPAVDLLDQRARQARFLALECGGQP